jgi:hypothetical protein
MYAELDAMDQRIKEKTDRMTPAQLRDYLGRIYVMLIRGINPSLNDISVHCDPWGGGSISHSLYAEHPYFSEYSFSSGPMQGLVRQWIINNRPEIDRAGIVHVGVRGRFQTTGAYLAVMDQRP